MIHPNAIPFFSEIMAEAHDIRKNCYPEQRATSVPLSYLKRLECEDNARDSACRHVVERIKTAGNVHLIHLMHRNDDGKPVVGNEALAVMGRCVRAAFSMFKPNDPGSSIIRFLQAVSNDYDIKIVEE